MIKKEFKVLAIPQDYWACGQYRIIQPYRDLGLRYNFMSKFEFNLFMPDKDSKLEFDFFNNYDVVIVQRLTTKKQVDFFKELKQKNPKIILIQDVDDNLFSIDSKNPFIYNKKDLNNFKLNFLNSLKVFDYLTVTNDNLRNFFSNVSKFPKEKILIFENAIDYSQPLIEAKLSRRKELPEDQIIFGWQGGSSHDQDLNILNFIPQILDKYNHVSFLFCSDHSTFNKKFGHLISKYKERIIFKEPITNHFDYFPSVPSMFDIGLAPLKINDFNNAKSYLKCLEYGVWGVPTVCSPSEDYVKFNKDNDLNLVVKNNLVTNWLEHISELIENNDYRKELNQKLKHIIENKYSLKEINKKRFNFFLQLYENGKK